MWKRSYTAYFLVLSSICYMSCQNSLKDVKNATEQITGGSVEVSTGVEIIYSDSAVVKAKIITPELTHVKNENPYYEMKKGLRAIFYNIHQQETSNIVADYGIQKEGQNIIELKNNVVVTNRDGKVFKSDELIWDSNKHQFYSNKLVSIITPTQTIHGTKFLSDESFSYYEIHQSTGNFDVSVKQ